MLRVTDILLRNLIIFMAEKDRAERRKKTDNRDKLVSTIRSLGKKFDNNFV